MHVVISNKNALYLPMSHMHIDKVKKVIPLFEQHI